MTTTIKIKLHNGQYKSHYKYYTMPTMIPSTEQEVNVEYEYSGDDIEIISITDYVTKEPVELSKEDRAWILDQCYMDTRH